MHLLKSGISSSSSTTIRDTELPLLVATVTNEIVKMTSDLCTAVSIDGGKSRLIDGAKMVVLTGTSPKLPFDAVLGFDVLLGHETGDTQAAFIDKVVSLYKWKKEDLRDVVEDTDTASVNDGTVSLLNAPP
jgi:hypothetical protein